MSDVVSKYYSEHIDKSLDELDKLLLLAENVSSDLSSARAIAFRQVVSVFMILSTISLTVVAVAFSQPKIMDAYPNFNFTSLVFGLAVGSVFGTYAVGSIIMAINQKRWRVERQIVADIIVMASSVLDSLRENIGSVEYTVLRMRMRRLGLSKDLTFAGISFP